MPVYNDKNIEQEVAINPVSVVKFCSRWDAACRSMEDPFKQISDEVRAAKFYECDINANQQFASAHKITKVPTTMIFIKGKPTAKVEGFNTKRSLREQIEYIIKKYTYQ